MSRRSARARWEPIVQRFNESGKNAQQWAEEVVTKKSRRKSVIKN